MGKAIIVLFLAFVLQSCAKGEDPTAAAKQCVTEQVAGQKISTVSERNTIAQRCDAAIRQWAFISIQRAYGRDFNVHNAKVQEEYRARKLAILQVLMPVDGDPLYM
jgi:hypothetical protein